MKKLSLYIFLVLMFSLFTSHSFAAKKHKIYKKLPCHFNGVKVKTSAQLHSDVKGGRCCPNCEGYKEKRGTSMKMRRGTPIVAIADMKLIQIKDHSAEQKSKKISTSLGKKHGKDHYQSQDIMKPYDDIHMYFIDKKGNVILYYHLKETNLVKGFNKGDCKIPKEYQWGKRPNLPRDCGGYSKELIKNNFWVKKGQVIGLSGQTGKGGAHISLGIAVPPDEELRNLILKIIKNSDEKKILVDWSKCDDARKPRYCYGSDFKLIPKSERKKIQNVTAIEPKYYRLAQTFFNYPYSFTGKYMRFTAPQRDFKWENLPTDSDAYLFPVMSKKYLKEIGYKK